MSIVTYCLFLSFCCKPSGYARSIAENKKNNGILKYFQETAVNNMIEGTVVVYGNCNFAPVSHVCFFIKDNGDGTYQGLQQNDKNRQYVTIDNNPYNGIIGAFIPNQILEEKKKKEQKTEAPTEPEVDEDKVKMEELEKQVKSKDKEITSLKTQIKTLEDRIVEVTEERDTLKENQPEEIFTCTKTGIHQLDLYEGEILCIKKNVA